MHFLYTVLSQIHYTSKSPVRHFLSKKVVKWCKSYKNGAIEKGDCIYLNGVRYSQTSELENYKISNVVICTSDSGRKLYEIEEYPDYEYIAGYCTWDGEIYKKDETD